MLQTMLRGLKRSAANTLGLGPKMPKQKSGLMLWNKIFQSLPGFIMDKRLHSSDLEGNCGIRIGTKIRLHSVFKVWTA